MSRVWWLISTELLQGMFLLLHFSHVLLLQLGPLGGGLPQMQLADHEYIHLIYGTLIFFYLFFPMKSIFTGYKLSVCLDKIP